MYIYVGKLTWLRLAENECFTLVFPVGLTLHDPVSVHWQWSVDGKGKEKVNNSVRGMVTVVSKALGEYRITVPIGLYTLEIAIAADRRSVVLTMGDFSGQRNNPTTLSLVHADTNQFPTAVLYTGKINYSRFAINELINFIAPAGISEHAPAGMYFQWTIDAKNVPKKNHIDLGILDGVKTLPDGTLSGVLNPSFYTYEFTFSPDKSTATAVMSAPDGCGPHTIAFERVRFVRSRVGAKKALIIRLYTSHGSGVDSDVSLVKEMLTEYLGFDSEEVETLYFNVNTNNHPKEHMGDQDRLTATDFRRTFIQLLSRARPGDVRFMYIDAQGRQPGTEEGRDVDVKTTGWTLAADRAGRRTEVISNDWVSEAIRKHLKAGVNLTILTSTSFGSGIIDATVATPGILLAACHETQFNTKALHTSGGNADPWTYAITTVIKRRAHRKRGVPSYTSIFNEAKTFIRSLMSSSDGVVLNRQEYLGPSPHETRPIPGDMASNTSFQDPQLIFNDGFIDPDAERFLFPIVAPTGGDAGRLVKILRYPRDEF